MSDEIHSMDYTEPKSGLKYRARFYADHDMRAPHEEHDGHGVTISLPCNVRDLLDSDEGLDDLDDDTVMRLPLFRELYSERGSYTYYDVLESISKAITAWGCSPEDAPAQVDKDFEYLRGWYHNEWHWMSISLTKLDEDGNETTDCTSLGGFESMLIDDKQELSSVLCNMAWDIESSIRAEVHKNQLPLPLPLAA